MSTAAEKDKLPARVKKQIIGSWKPMAFLSEIHLTFVAVVGLAGLVLIWSATKLHSEHDATISHVLRDVGIALLVSIIITVLIEYHAHRRKQLETEEAAAEALLVSVLGEDVWREVRGNVLKQGIICSNWNLKLVYAREQITEVPGELPVPRDLVKGQLTYTLGNESGVRVPVQLLHELENTITGFGEDRRTLPRYSKLKYEIRSLEAPDSPFTMDFNHEDLVNSKNCSPDGLLQFNIELPPGARVNVTLDREELVPTPGHFPWYMFWVTRHPKVEITQAPPELEFEIVLRHPMGIQTRPRGPRAWNLDGVFFPGQGFSVRSKRAMKPAIIAGTETNPPSTTASPAT